MGRKQGDRPLCPPGGGRCGLSRARERALGQSGQSPCFRTVSRLEWRVSMLVRGFELSRGLPPVKIVDGVADLVYIFIRHRHIQWKQ
jgi:hypothetical protein